MTWTASGKTHKRRYCDACAGPKAHAYRVNYAMCHKVKDAILAAEGGKCPTCGAPLTPEEARIHHRGRYVIAVLCHRCNQGREPVLWEMWQEGTEPPGAWADIVTDDAARWPATRALGYVGDKVPRDRWKGDHDFVARPASPATLRP